MPEKAVLDWVLTWPSDRQENAARLLTEMEELENHSYSLTDERLAS